MNDTLESAHQNCTECGHPLIWRGGRLICAVGGNHRPDYRNIYHGPNVMLPERRVIVPGDVDG